MGFDGNNSYKYLFINLRWKMQEQHIKRNVSLILCQNLLNDYIYERITWSELSEKANIIINNEIDKTNFITNAKFFKNLKDI